MKFTQLVLNKFNEEQIEWIARAICSMACSDGRIDPIELKCLKNTLGQVADKSFCDRLSVALKYKKVLNLEPPNGISKEDAFDILLFLGQLSLSDSKLTSGEVEYLQYVADILDFPFDVCHGMIELITLGRDILRAEQQIKDDKVKWDENLKVLRKVTLGK